MPYVKGYIAGDRKVTCDVCGWTYRFSQMRKGVMGTQKGFDICPSCFDGVHPRKTAPAYRPEGILPEVR